MATTFCVICGTEVDEQATFCPACGNPMDAPPTNEIPQAPAWPRRRRSDEPAGTDASETPTSHDTQVADALTQQDDWAPPVDATPSIEPTPTYPTAPTDEEDVAQAPVMPDPAEPAGEAATPADEERMAARPGPAIPPPVSATTSGGRAPGGGVGPAGASVQTDEPRSASQFDLPVTWPVTLSGWLIGVGSFVGALAVLLDFRAFTNPVTLVAFLLLLGVAATVFFSANVPAIPHRQMWVLVIVLVAFGAAFERVGAGTYFAGLVFFLATGAAAVGAVILELGMDRPLGGTGG